MRAGSERAAAKRDGKPQTCTWQWSLQLVSGRPDSCLGPESRLSSYRHADRGWVSEGKKGRMGEEEECRPCIFVRC